MYSSSESVSAQSTTSATPESPKPAQAKTKMKKPVDFSKPQTFVTIIAGKGASQETFVVHKSLVSHHSRFFEKAFASSFTEGITQSMTIDDIDSAAFGLLVHWLYTQGLRDREGEDIPTALLLAKVWVLAGRFIMPLLQNFAMDRFRTSLVSSDDWPILLSVISYAYEVDKPEHSPLRNLIVERFAFGRRENWLDQMDKVPQSFVIDVIKLMFAFHDRQIFKSRGKISLGSDHHVEINEDNE